MTFRAAPHLEGLKDFQRRTVDHIIDRFYGDSTDERRTGRFLVADETGLGKSIVARGVIARAVEHLESTGQRRITVLYVCSNQDLARQNLRRLNITGDPEAELDTRLSMLATRPELLDGGAALGDATFTLIPLTPGTSLQSARNGLRGGMRSERALLAVILEHLTEAGDAGREAGLRLLHGAAGLEGFTRHAAHLRDGVEERPLDPRIVESFAAAIGSNGVLEEFIRQREDVLRSGELTPGREAWNRRLTLIADLRQHLARAGADVLEPDLIVLDEFQRFRQLLSAEDSPDGGESLELAHTLFNHPRAKLLLLSATPYAPYTRGGDEEDHHSDFLSTLDFLHRHREEPRRRLRRALSRFRAALTQNHTGPAGTDPAGPPSSSAAQEVREALLPVMSRAERPPLAEQTDLVEVIRQEADAPLPEDFSDWIVLRRLGDVLGTHVTAEYWKSVPHFSTFMEGYQFGRRVRDRIAEGDSAVSQILRQTTRITREQVQAHEPLDLGHGYLRRMVEQTVEAGWWKMLWLPSSMPYTRNGAHYRPLAAQSPTKRLIFSAWRSVPTAVACLLSYEADRRIITALREQLPADRRDRTAASHYAGRLRWGLRDDGQPAAMNTLALFWPHAGLAAAGDPLAAPVGTAHDDDLPTWQAHREMAERRLRETLTMKTPHAPQPWEAVFAAGPQAADQARSRWLREMGRQERETSRNWDVHLDHVVAAPQVSHWHEALPVLAAHSPGSIAFRCLTRVAPAADESARFRAAWTLSLGLRNLFNRGDTARLLAALDGLPSPERPYWRQVADYCADGGLESVLDEYLFQLSSEQGTEEVSEEQLIDLAQRAVIGMSLLPAAYVGHDYTAADPAVPFSARYALRYGGRHQSDGSDSDARRQGEVRSSFNSPFPPFVLASTSVGQEGIDFHWWCHRVVHWNLPSNPVDFEQREGRVNRFGGHAVRKNVSHHHGPSVLAGLGATPENPWHRAFADAEAQPSQHGAFSPWWIYPGPARIQRVIMSYPHSRDMPRYERLRDLLTSYRLTLGQPRQEDMLALIGDPSEHATIDLSPPAPPSG